MSVIGGFADRRGRTTTNGRHELSTGGEARPEEVMVGDTPFVTLASARIDLRSMDRFDVEATVVAAFDAHAAALKGFAAASARDPDAAEDLVQESFVRLVRELQSGRQIDNVRAWLFAVCANLAISQARRRSTRDRLRFRLLDSWAGESPEESLLRRDDDAELRAGLSRLRLEERTALLLSAAGLSAAEVGAAIGRTPHATRTFICRARLRLREEMSRREDARS